MWKKLYHSSWKLPQRRYVKYAITSEDRNIWGAHKTLALPLPVISVGSVDQALIGTALDETLKSDH